MCPFFIISSKVESKIYRFLLNKQVGSDSDRKNDDSYLEFGLIWIEVNSKEGPQCVICLKILRSESILPSKPKRNLETIHPDVVKKSRIFFVSCKIYKNKTIYSTSLYT